MKTFNTIASIVLLIAVAYLFISRNSSPTGSEVGDNLKIQDQKGIRVAYINTDSLAEKYNLHSDLKSKLEEKAKILEADLSEKSKVFDENIAILQQQAANMSQERLQQAQQDLERKRQELLMYRDQKTQELAMQEQELNKMIMDDLDTVLAKIKSENELDFIFSHEPGGLLLSANEDYDITKMVVDRLNKRYAKEQEKAEVETE